MPSHNMSMRLVLTLVFCLQLALSQTLWDYTFPRPFGKVDLTGAATGANQIIIVGPQGTLLQSSDGETWTQCPSPIDGNYLFVDYTNGFYILSDENKAMAYSSTGTCNGPWTVFGQAVLNHIDGLTTMPSPVPPDWNLGFAGTNREQLYYSRSGTPGTFIQASTLDTTKWAVWALAYGQNIWLAKLASLPIGTDPVPISTVSSNDGQNWSAPLASGFTAKYDFGLSYCAKSYLFIASFEEGIATSPNGYNWTIVTPLSGTVLNTLVCDNNDRCVGSNDTHVFDSVNCGQGFVAQKLDIDYIANDFPIVSQVLVQGKTTQSFIVAGISGAAFYSNTLMEWNSFGTIPKETEMFNTCNQLLWVDEQKYFVLNCHRATLVSADAVNWSNQTYQLDPLGLYQLQEIAHGHDSAFYAFANQNLLFFSNDGTVSWDEYIRITIREDDDDMSLTGMQYLHERWVAYGFDTVSSGGDVIPIIAQSLDGVFWEIGAPSAWINEMQYSPVLGRFVAVGRNGIYLADPRNMTSWTRVSESNGECTTLTTNGQWRFVALCDNTVVSGVDSIVKVSADGGQSWVDYYSPCGTSTQLGTVSNFDCVRLAWIESWNSFVIGSATESGVIYSSDPSGVNWAQVSWPYAVQFIDFVQGGSKLVTLTTNQVYSGNVNNRVLGTFAPGVVYNQNTSSALLSYPLVGDITILPPPNSFQSYFDQSSDDESGYNGGQIFGIVFGVLVGTLLVFICIPIVVFALIVIKRKISKGSPESTPFAINQNYDEDDAL